MRPYSIRKEDTKYIQPVISNATGTQPSPLALLAATCSRIGDTFQENTTIFTHKNLAIEKGQDDITTLKSCVDTRPNPLVCPDRTIDLQQNSLPTCQGGTPQISTSCFKIKHEQSYDYNHNCEPLHSCANVITETRMLDNQARNSFSKSCSRDTIQSTCGHSQQEQQEHVPNFNFNTSPSCEHVNIPSQCLSPQSSCAFQNTIPSSSSQQSNCVLDNVSLPAANPLSHVPPITQSLHYSSLENYQPRTKFHSSWQQSQYQRNSLPDEKLQHENFTTPTPSIPANYPTSSASTYTRSYRHSLSHMGATSDPSYERQHVLTQPQEQYFHPNINTNSNSPHSFHYPPNFNMDVKQEPYPSQPSTPMASNYPPHSQLMQPPQVHQPLPAQLNMSHTGHNHPAGMASSFCNACNPHGGAGYMGEMVPGGPTPMTGIDLQSQTMAEYQYQQQQMMYARDNRRPRRIACTCPNCRDGENKTVTTKDGKQRKLHVCHIPGCGKIYGKTSHLRAHLRWHAGERPFACNWLFCNKRFTRSDELQRHRRTHTGDKRFECNVCMKKFMRSDHLSKHMKTHQTQKQNKDKLDNSSGGNSPDKTNETSSSTVTGESEKTKS